MTVQVKIDPNTGLTKCGNTIEKEKSIQCLFSTTIATGIQDWGLGIPNVLRNAEQILSHSMNNKNGDFVEACYDPHAYWSVDHRPVGTKQIIDSGIFSYLYGQYSKTATLKDIEKYADFYIQFVNHHFEQHCLTNNTPWFVELDIQGRWSYDDYKRIRKKLLDSCPDRDFIGVWHSEHGLKSLEEICEMYDFVSIGTAYGDNIGVKRQGFYWVAEHYPEKLCHMLGTHRIQEYIAPSLLHSFVDTCDSTSWSAGARFGITGKMPGGGAYRRAWVAPAIKWCAEHWFSWFPKYVSESAAKKRWHNKWGITEVTEECYLWGVCKVWCIFSYFNLYGKQKQWENAGFRRVIKKILDGKGAELTIDDIDPFTYEMPHQIHIGDTPRIFNVAEGYQDKFKNVKKTLFNL